MFDHDDDSFSDGLGQITAINLSICILVFPLIFIIGLFQFIYVIPWWIKMSREGKKEKCKGVIVGVLITLLLNAACYAYFGSIYFNIS